ncbi:MAG TPA: tetratricopeptide repeat protein [Candidatus Angelobacter sp.]|nr:tetratricopeptide repeat protein [Candidatus Angelobacter sp.]
MDTNASPDQTNELRNDALTASLLQIQEQLHNTQLALQENQQVAAALARSNSDMLTAHLQSLEQTLITQRAEEAEEAHKTAEWTLLLTGVIGLAGLGILLWMVYLQTRAFTKLTEISIQQNAVMANASAVHQLAAPARAVVENSNAKLLEVVGQLKDRITELELGTPSLPIGAKTNGITNGMGNGRPKAEALAEGQKHLDQNEPQQALEIIDRYLAGHPDDPEALLKKADALQKIGRNDEALAHYNRVIAADGSMAVAHLQKGGLLNRLRRYDEALNCYEQALQAQEKKRR